MATTTNYGWTTPDDTSLVKDGAAAIRTLGSSIDTTTKNLNPSTTLGDIEYRSSSANTNTRLGIGTTGQVLTVSGGVPSWQTSSSGGMTLISETVASAVTGITFGSIPSTYKQLLLMWSGTNHSTSGSGFVVRFNNNSSSIYTENYVSFSASTLANNGSTGDSVGGGLGLSTFGAENNTSDVRYTSKGFLLIDNYASTTKAKTFETTFFYRNIANNANVSYNGVGYYDSTTAITSLDIVRTYGTATLSNTTNTTIRLYGLL